MDHPSRSLPILHEVPLCEKAALVEVVFVATVETVGLPGVPEVAEISGTVGKWKMSLKYRALLRDS